MKKVPLKKVMRKKYEPVLEAIIAKINNASPEELKEAYEYIEELEKNGKATIP